MSSTMTDRSARGTNARGFTPLVCALIVLTGCAGGDSAPHAVSAPAAPLPSLAVAKAKPVELAPAAQKAPVEQKSPAAHKISAELRNNQAIRLASAEDGQSSPVASPPRRPGDSSRRDPAAEKAESAEKAEAATSEIKTEGIVPAPTEVLPEDDVAGKLSNAAGRTAAANPKSAPVAPDPKVPQENPSDFAPSEPIADAPEIPAAPAASTVSMPLPWGPSKTSPEMAAVCARAETAVRSGFNLAERGAMYSARSQFIEALRILTEALDAQHNTTAHSRALNAGLRAMQEVNDFAPRSGEVDANLNFRLLVDSHHTPVLKSYPLDQISALQAQRQYLAYAQEQLTAAGADQPVASLALQGLGKICTAPAEMHGPQEQIAEAKAVVYHQAALMVEPKNFMAANELGVLLAHFGRLPESRSALEHAVAMSGGPTEWQNLAVICDRLNDPARAADARQQSILAGERLRSSGYTSAGMKYPIQWLDPDSFATTNTSIADAAPVTATNSTQMNSVVAKNSSSGAAKEESLPAIAAKPQPKSGFWSWLK
jgi:hypothetical protein